MIVESIIIVNLFITVACVWVAMLVNSKFLRPAILNEKRFALYELRDKLAMLAMRDVISPDSEEYLTLLKLMNNSIRSTKGFRITRFLKIQSEIIFDQDVRNHLNNILKKVHDDKMPEEYRKIVSEYFKVARALYKHKTWMFRLILSPLIFIVAIVARSVHAAKKLNEYLIFQKDRVTKIEIALETNMERFAG